MGEVRAVGVPDGVVDQLAGAFCIQTFENKRLSLFSSGLEISVYTAGALRALGLQELGTSTRVFLILS